jgi:hypothetical protein
MFYLKEKSTVVYSRIFLELFWLFQIVPLASVGISVEEKKNESFSRSGTFFFKRDLYQTTCALLRDLRFTNRIVRRHQLVRTQEFISVALMVHQRRSCVEFDGAVFSSLTLCGSTCQHDYT